MFLLYLTMPNKYFTRTHLDLVRINFFKKMFCFLFLLLFYMKLLFFSWNCDLDMA